jgi:hypothetical protein
MGRYRDETTLQVRAGAAAAWVGGLARRQHWAAAMAVPFSA